MEQKTTSYPTERRFLIEATWCKPNGFPGKYCDVIVAKSGKKALGKARRKIIRKAKYKYVSHLDMISTLLLD